MHFRSTLESPPMTSEEALAYWFGRINYEHRAPRPTDLKLDRMRTLLALLVNPQDKLRIVHVAGSKGKGSTSAMIESILRIAGYRTGLFTSPHLCQVEERIQVDASPIPPQDLAVLMTEIREVIRKMEEAGFDSPISGQAVTFFEVATALGFLYFARQQVDVAVIEVGLGGRFDSTNVCQPLVSVITSISFDHTQQLGNQLASIAMEKAGIVKPGRPTVSGVMDPEPRHVIESICHERHSPLLQLGRDFHFEYEPGRVGKDETRRQGSGVRSQNQRGVEAAGWRLLQFPRVGISTAQQVWGTMPLGLWGAHQAANAAVAVACIEQLRKLGLKINDKAVHDGLADVRWPARMEIMNCQPIVILDCAHNVASAQALVKTLCTSFPPTRSEYQERNTEYSIDDANERHGGKWNWECMVKDLGKGLLGKRVLIFAGSSDKDLAGMLEVLAPPFEHIFLTRYSHSPRAVPAERLAEILRHQTSVPITICSTPAEAWETARKMSGPYDLICVTGSVFLAGELRLLMLRDLTR